jgi:hypothetical protein
MRAEAYLALDFFVSFCIKYTVFANYQPGKVTCKSSAISGRLFVLGKTGKENEI